MTSSFRKHQNQDNNKLPQMTFQNKILQDFFSIQTTNSPTNPEVLIKVFNMPPEESSNSFKGPEKKSIQLKRKEIVLDSGKPSIADDIQSKLKNYINKKIQIHSNSNSLATSIVRVKKLSPHPTAFNSKLETESEGKFVPRAMSVRESCKDLSSKFLVQNLKKSIPVFTKLVIK